MVSTSRGSPRPVNRYCWFVYAASAVKPLERCRQSSKSGRLEERTRARDRRTSYANPDNLVGRLEGQGRQDDGMDDRIRRKRDGKRDGQRRDDGQADRGMAAQEPSALRQIGEEATG